MFWFIFYSEFTDVEYLNDDNDWDILGSTAKMPKNDFNCTEELIIANDMDKVSKIWLVRSSLKIININCVPSFSENLNYLDSSNISNDSAADNV